MNIQVTTTASQQSIVSSDIAQRINGITSLADEISHHSAEAVISSIALKYNQK
jgi:methyl-accepting chemotaxis protein